MIIYLPDISKSNLPRKLWGGKIVYKYSGDKTCCVPRILKVNKKRGISWVQVKQVVYIR